MTAEINLFSVLYERLSGSALITYKVNHIHSIIPQWSAHIPARPTRRSSIRPLLTVPLHLTSSDDPSCFVSPTVLNSLPSDIQSSQWQATFKWRLKTHLFNIAFNEQPELWCYVTSFRASGSVKVAPGALQIGLLLLLLLSTVVVSTLREWLRTV